MLLGDYYDAVMAETQKTAAVTDVESVKIAEVISNLDEQGVTFQTKEAAEAAVKTAIEDDYAEKVAMVCQEFETDKVAFSADEEKVAAAMEIVDGWESLTVANANSGKKASELI